MLKYLVIHVEPPDGANIPLISHIKIDYAGQNCVEAHKVYNRLLSEKALDTQIFFSDPLAEVEYAQYERAVDFQK